MLKIRRIVVRYLLGITLVMVAVILCVSVAVQRGLERRIARHAAQDMFFQIGQLLGENQRELASVQEEYRQSCLSNAETVAYMIQHNPGILGDVEELRRIAEFVEVDEIHVFDKTGRIFTGTHPEYYDYTFDSGAQMGFFKPMLRDKTLRLCQDIMPNTAEGKLVQYSALWDSTGEFIVEIGMYPVNVLKATRKNELSYIFSLLKASVGVSLYAVDEKSGRIVGSTVQDDMGKNLGEIGLDPDGMERLVRGAHASVDGVDSWCIFTRMDGTLLGYVVSGDVLYRSLPLRTAGLAACLMVVALLLVASVTWCTDHFVIDGIQSVNEKLRSIAEGNLDERVEIRTSAEFFELSAHINELINVLLSSTDRISHILNHVNMHIGVYEYSGKMRSVRFTEHVPSVLRIEGGMMTILTGDHRLFREYIDELRENFLPGEEDVFRLLGDEPRYVRLEEVVSGSYTLGIVIDVTEEIATRRRIEEERDIDFLTGLLNRKGLAHRLQELFDSPEELALGALCMIDADGLKAINDVHGHAAGDMYLRKIADSFRGFGRRGSVSARVGGDEFVLFLYGYGGEEERAGELEALRQIQAAGATAQLGRSLSVPLSFSFGWSPTSGVFDYQAVLHEADERMYEDKRERKRTPRRDLNGGTEPEAKPETKPGTPPGAKPAEPD